MDQYRVDYYQSPYGVSPPEHVNSKQTAAVRLEVFKSAEELQQEREAAMIALQGIREAAEHRYDIGEALVGEVSNHVRSFGWLATHAEQIKPLEADKPQPEAPEEYIGAHRAEPTIESATATFSDIELAEIRQAVLDAYKRDGVTTSVASN